MVRLTDYVGVALKDLRRQRVRSTLTIIALVISTAIVVTMAAISIGGRKAIVNQLSPDNSLTTIVVTPNQNAGTLSLFGNIQKFNPGANKLDDGVVARLAKLPGVQSAVPEAYIWEFASFSLAGSSQQFVAQANGVPDGSAVPLSAGSSFAANDNRHVVMLGLAYARQLGWGKNPAALIGKTLQIVTQKGYRGAGASIPGPTATAAQTDQFNQTTTTLTATIVGVTATGSDQNGLFIPLNWARAVRTIQYWVYDAGKAAGVHSFNPAPEQIGDLKTTDQIAADGYSTILVKAATTSDVKTVAAAINQLGYGEVSTLSEVQRLQQFSTTMWVILGSVAIIAVVAAALGVVNTMLMAVSEQRYAIGVWRACGARRGFIARQFLLEAGLLGLIGGLLGAGVGIGVTDFVNRRLATLLKSQGLNVTTVAQLPLWLLGATIGLTTIFGIIAGLYPAWQAARQDPSKALTSGQ